MGRRSTISKTGKQAERLTRRHEHRAACSSWVPGSCVYLCFFPGGNHSKFKCVLFWPWTMWVTMTWHDVSILQIYRWFLRRGSHTFKLHWPLSCSQIQNLSWCVPSYWVKKHELFQQFHLNTHWKILYTAMYSWSTGSRQKSCIHFVFICLLVSIDVYWT